MIKRETLEGPEADSAAKRVARNSERSIVKEREVKDEPPAAKAADGPASVAGGTKARAGSRTTKIGETAFFDAPARTPACLPSQFPFAIFIDPSTINQRRGNTLEERRMKLVLIMVAGISSSAFGAYTVQSRFSEVKRFNFDNQFPTQNEILGTTTGFGAFTVLSGSNPPFQYYQNSSLSAGGAIYSGLTEGSASVGPPAGSGLSGSYIVSKFQIVFDVSVATDFTLAASLQRIWYGNVTLKLEPLSVGASPAMTAIALGQLENNFAPTLVNWSGTLLAGQYRLSIEDHAGNPPPGIIPTGTNSSFTFSIPAPSAAGLLLALAIPAARRRRS